jgi:hypothetical protein
VEGRLSYLSQYFGLLGMKLKLNDKVNDLAFMFVSGRNNESVESYFCATLYEHFNFLNCAVIGSCFEGKYAY